MDVKSGNILVQGYDIMHNYDISYEEVDIIMCLYPYAIITINCIVEYTIRIKNYNDDVLVYDYDELINSNILHNWITGIDLDRIILVYN